MYLFYLTILPIGICGVLHCLHYFVYFYCLTFSYEKKKFHMNKFFVSMLICQLLEIVVNLSMLLPNCGYPLKLREFCHVSFT